MDISVGAIVAGGRGEGCGVGRKIAVALFDGDDENEGRARMERREAVVPWRRFGGENGDISFCQ